LRLKNFCLFHRLDRKSSRGMIYENEELRLRTININAEIERGQYDIKKLKRENEMLKKEIWCLRDEYDKLDKLLKEKEYDFSSSSTTCSTSDSVRPDPAETNPSTSQS
jgi:predicted nuclease with TOPRIM domain